MSSPPLDPLPLASHVLDVRLPFLDLPQSAVDDAYLASVDGLLRSCLAMVAAGRRSEDTLTVATGVLDSFLIGLSALVPQGLLLQC